MCGRFNVTDDPYAQALLKTLGIDIGPLPPPRYNIAPTDRVPVMLDNDGMAQWLDHDADTQALASLFEPVLLAPLVITPVDQSINNSRNKIEPQPIGDTEKLMEATTKALLAQTSSNDPFAAGVLTMQCTVVVLLALEMQAVKF